MTSFQERLNPLLGARTSRPHSERSSLVVLFPNRDRNRQDDSRFALNADGTSDGAPGNKPRLSFKEAHGEVSSSKAKALEFAESSSKTALPGSPAAVANKSLAHLHLISV